jgi:imidazolonepropionase-like amidohydrolase
MTSDRQSSVKPRLAVCAAGAAAVLVAAAGAEAAKDDVYAIVGARVVSVSGPTHERATVVLRDGVIVAVAPDAQAPPDARVIDGSGLVLTPGLIDAFGGVGLPAPAPRPAGGGSGAPAPTPTPSPLSPQTHALDAIRASEVVKARDAGVTTALVIPKDGILPGQSVLINLSGDKAEAMAWKQPAALHLHLNTLTRQYPSALMGTLAYARQALLDAARYRDEWAAYEKAPLGRKRPRYDAALQAWLPVVQGTLPLVVGATRENDVRRALALADEFKVRVVVAGATQAQRLAGLIKQRKLPLLVSVNFDPPRPARGGFFGFGGGDEEHERREIDEAERNPAELHRQGVAFALASGHARDFLGGVRKAIERGLPREAALRALTLGAAEALGVADRTGSLEAGKMANLVAWSGEPLTREARPKLVFVDGKLHEPEERSGAGEGRAARGGEAARAEADKGEQAAEKTERAAAPGPPASPFPAAPRRAPDRPLAIKNATLLTAGPQGTIEKGTLVVRGGKIAALGRDVAIPPDALVIDAASRFVTPGIVDAHSHTAVEENVNECSDSITAEVRIRDVIDQRDVNIYRQLAGGVTTINVLHGSCNSIGGQNAVLKLRWGRSPDELVFREAPRGIKFALGENVKRSNFSAPGPRRYPGTRMGVEAVIREGFEEARAYKREWEEYERRLRAAGARGEKPVAPRRNLRLETLRDVLDGKVLVHAHCYRSDEILMLIRLADELGFKVRTFQHVLEGYKVASEIARHGAGGSTFSDWWAYKLEAWDAIPYNAAIMAAKGVRVSLNSDSNELARRLYWEAAKAVKYGGVSEQEALKMITLHPAWQLGVDTRVGSLEVGKDADIAIFNVHPFAPDARVETTLVDGVVYFDRREDLAAREPFAPTATGGAR